MHLLRIKISPNSIISKYKVVEIKEEIYKTLQK